MPELHRYRVVVTSTVVIEARNVMDAKAQGETAVRKAIDHAYLTVDLATGRSLFGDGLEEFRFQARKAERIRDDE